MNREIIPPCRDKLGYCFLKILLTDLGNVEEYENELKYRGENNMLLRHVANVARVWIDLAIIVSPCANIHGGWGVQVTNVNRVF